MYGSSVCSCEELRNGEGMREGDGGLKVEALSDWAELGSRSGEIGG